MIEALALALTAAVAVAGSIGSVLLLAVRVGRLMGSTGARITASETDRGKLWAALGVLTHRLDRHIEQPHPRRQ